MKAFIAERFFQTIKRAIPPAILPEKRLSQVFLFLFCFFAASPSGGSANGGAETAAGSLDSAQKEAAPSLRGQSPENSGENHGENSGENLGKNLEFAPVPASLTPGEEALTLDKFIIAYEAKSGLEFGENTVFFSRQVRQAEAFYYGESGLASPSQPISSALAFYLLAPFLYRQFWEEEALSKSREALRDANISDREKKIRLKSNYENMRKILLEGKFLEYFRAHLSREAILEAIKHSAESKRAGHINVPFESSGEEGADSRIINVQTQAGVNGIYGIVPAISQDGAKLERNELMPLLTGIPAMAAVYDLSFEERRQLEERIYQRVIDSLEARQASAIAVNMYKDHSPFGAMKLARHIKENDLDIHVFGYCNLSCSNYLLPAAKNIYIGDYGVILFGGELFLAMDSEVRGFFNDFAAKARAEFMGAFSKAGGDLERLYGIYTEEASEEFKEYIQQKGNQDLFYKFHRAIVDIYSRYSRLGKAALGRSDRTGFIMASKRFSKEERSLLHDFLFLRENPLIRQGEHVLDHIEYNKNEEVRFFQDILGEGAGAEISYVDFLRFAHDFSKYNPWFWLLFEGKISRKGYSAPEEAKMNFIIPSAETLRDIGLNVQEGENSLKKLPPSLVNTASYMELSRENIQRCGFFEGGVGDYSPENLKNCLNPSR